LINVNGLIIRPRPGKHALGTKHLTTLCRFMSSPVEPSRPMSLPKSAYRHLGVGNKDDHGKMAN